METATSSPSTDDDNSDVPPPRRMLRRLGWSLLAGVLLVLLARLGWGWEAERRLNAKIEELNARGIPVRPEDFALPEVADFENAAVSYAEAIEVLVPGIYDAMRPLSTQPSDASGVVVQPPPNMLLTKRVFDANAKTLTLLRRARACDACRWDHDVEPGFTTRAFSTPWSARRNLFKLLCFGAEYQHHIGNDAEAVELLMDGLLLSDRMTEPPAFLIDLLVHGGCVHLAANIIEQIAPALSIARVPTSGEGEDRSAPRERVEALISRLYDGRFAQAATRNAAHGECVHAYDSHAILMGDQPPSAALAPAATPWWEAILQWLRSPQWQLDCLAQIEGLATVSEHTDCLSIYEYRRNVPVIRKPVGPVETWLHSPLLDGVEISTRTFERHFVRRTHRQMAGVLLAIRLYELDHGHRPARLELLVPDYLPTPPIDPFSPAGDLLRYKPDDDPPLLYSIGPSGNDDGGYHSATLDSGENGRADTVYRLDGGRGRDRRNFKQ